MTLPLADVLAGAGEPADPAAPALLGVDLDGAPAGAAAEAAARRLAALGRPLVGVATGPVPPALLDAVLLTLTTAAEDDRRTVHTPDPGAALAAIEDRATAHPHATAVLADVLTASAALPVADALRVESFAYSTLLAGPDFAAWCAARPPRRAAAPDLVPVAARREGADLVVELADPDRRNAFGAAMREGLLAALDVARWDPGVRAVRLSGRGPAFCAGGDLAEFGTGPGGPAAHLVRTRRSVGAALHELNDRTVVRLHGACVGAGIELPAFAGHLVAAPDLAVRLPEQELGLIPGAGGTVSLPRRIGRWRTAWLALTGEVLGAERALAWGLVDELSAA